jgi:hypothetical protein
MELSDQTYQEPRWIYLADLNGDGWLDLFVPQIIDDRSFVLWNGPEGFSVERAQLLATGRISCAQAADLTGNGTLDLIVGGHTPSADGPHDSFMSVYWNGPNGLSDDRKTLLPANGINAIAVADFNRDGHLDLFCSNYHDARVRDIDSYLYWGMEGGRFSATNRQRLFMHSASGALAVDFNEDGWIDLAAAYHKVYGDHQGHSAVWWNGPEGFREDRTTTLPSLGPHGLMRFGMGNQRDRGPEELYVSAPREVPAGARLTALEWEAELPPRTWLRAQVRSAATEEALAEAAWTGPAGLESWFTDSGDIAAEVPLGPWVQYRLALGATNACGTPRVSAVTLSWKTSP